MDHHLSLGPGWPDDVSGQALNTRTYLDKNIGETYN